MTVEHADGSTVLDLAYVEHRIIAGKPQHDPTGRLPATYVESDAEADTLEIVLADVPSGLRVELSYTIFADRPVVARSARIRNDGPAAIRLTGAMSLSLDLPDADWDLVQLSGGWARENHVVTRRLRPGRQSVGSDHGSSGHEHNPFIALRRAGDDRVRGRGRWFQPRLLGQLPGRGRGGHVRDRPRAARDQPDDLHVDARTRGGVHDTGGGDRLLRWRARGDERRLPRALSRAPRTRRLARRPATHPAQYLGRRLFRLRRGAAARDRERVARPRRRAVRAR